MNQIVLDDSLRAKLNGLDQHVALLDEAGRTVGHFVPEAHYKKMLYANAQCPFTEEEIAQFFSEPGGSTLAEIWQRLGREW